MKPEHLKLLSDKDWRLNNLYWITDKEGKATRFRMAVIASSIGLPIAWPNITFEPPDDAPYGRVYVLPAQTVGQDFEGELRKYQGILQLNIIVPAGSGVTQAREMAKSIADAFPEGLPLVDGDLAVYINGPPQIRPTIQGNINITHPVSMQYRADYA